MRRKWRVFYIEVRKEGLASCKTEISARTQGEVVRRIYNNNRMVTGVVPIKPTRQRKAY